MKKHSIWKVKTALKNNNQMTQNNFDIAIVGAGITGLSLAYFLKDTKKRIVLIEKSNALDNTTSKSTAKLSFVQQDIYQKLEKNFGYDISKLYFESQAYAISLMKKIIVENNISCDLEKSNSYLFSMEEENLKILQREKELLTCFGCKCKTAKNLEIPIPVKKAFYVEGNYTFNPVKYMQQITKIVAKKVTIYDNLMVEGIKRQDNYYLLKTKNGVINAKKVVVTNHYPFFIKPYFLPFKNYIKREYVNAAKYSHNENFNAINVDKNLCSIRFYKDYIIYVSNSHRLTNKLDIEKNYCKSRDDFYHFFKKMPEYSWVNQDLITNDYLPVIGEIEKNLYISTGYNAWGMTNGVLGSKIIADLLQNKKNVYASLVNPNRVSAGSILNSIVDALAYIHPYIAAPFYGKNIKVTEEDGVKYNVYEDENGKVHKVRRKCPHLKCNLLFNQEELTWDCPCHGSRFDLDGKLIEGPSKEDIN